MPFPLNFRSSKKSATNRWTDGPTNRQTLKYRCVKQINQPWLSPLGASRLIPFINLLKGLGVKWMGRTAHRYWGVYDVLFFRYEFNLSSTSKGSYRSWKTIVKVWMIMKRESLLVTLLLFFLLSILPHLPLPHMPLPCLPSTHPPCPSPLTLARLTLAN